MNDIVGIDLGTTNSLIGVMDSGFPVLIADSEGSRLTPSVVHFPEKGNPIIGVPARRMLILEPERTVYSVKRLIGRRPGESEKEDLPFAVKSVDGRMMVDVRGNRLTPEQVSNLVLRKLKADAEQSLARPIDRAVITVPAYFNDLQRQATKRAGELAGFSVERIINEPTAAALAYGLNRLRDRSRIAVYDLGGGTFDVSILELNDGVFRVLSTNGNTRLGGDDIDREFVRLLKERIIGRHPDLRPAVEERIFLARLRAIAHAAKLRLSTEDIVAIEIPFLRGSNSFSYSMTRQELEAIARPIIRRTRSHCIRSLDDAKLDPAKLDEVILVGGVTRMPSVRQFVAEVFQRLPNITQNPDEAVAVGATIQAGILSGHVQDIVLLDVTPLSLGIETFGGLMNVLIPRNSTIPCKAGEMSTNAVPNQKSMQIRVLQGERELAKDNWELGRFQLAFQPVPKGVARVGVQFEIDADGILHVLARDTRSGREKIVEMKSAVDVDDSAVQKMVEESVEHAFEDLAARRWIEAKLKATETLAATKRALTTYNAEIETDYRQKIEAAICEVETILRATHAETETGDLKALQSACAALDEETRHMAELLM